MYRISKFILFAGLWLCVSCDQDTVDDLLGNDTVVTGLKTALDVGTDSTVNCVSKVGGYLNDQTIKILLPDKARDAINLLDKAPAVKTAAKALGIDVDAEVSKMVTALNHAAEDAAKEAAPIFKKAITDLTITDGLTILKGSNPAIYTKSTLAAPLAAFDSTAATSYLQSKTYDDLVKAYAVPVNKVLDSGGDASPAAMWRKFTTTINTVAAIKIPLIENPLKNKVIDDDLGAYVTGKALDGLFSKVGGVEKNIRKDPFGWAKKTGKDILSRVFGTK